ncbi:unnamed protein product [Caenorhabditis sp. 36 PRJEB53466]|nr:unnamed protein product [Caenorhabditis sp. 36 PRJEB53466]
MEAWTQFFIRAGIPNDIAGKYAKKFNTNRITKEMLPELDKPTLTELGVTAIGDQLCILRRIKAAKSTLERSMDTEEDEPEEEEMPAKKVKSRITAPATYSPISGVSELRRGKPPPDRNEIYHVKMPAGNTIRTRTIMRKAAEMRQQGLAVRGTTGVRQGGRDVSPIDKTSLAARLMKKQSAEVSSSTDRHHGTKIGRISSSTIKKTIANRPSLRSRLTTVTPSSSGIRIHMDSRAQPNSRIEGRLQRASGGVETSGRRADVVVEYEDDVTEYEEVMEDDVDYVDDDQVMYEDELVEEEVVSVPVRQRLSYGSSAPNRVASTVHRAPIAAPTRSSDHNSHNRRRNEKASDSVFSRVSYHRR